jgi:hypothetical protein
MDSVSNEITQPNTETLLAQARQEREYWRSQVYHLETTLDEGAATIRMAEKFLRSRPSTDDLICSLRSRHVTVKSGLFMSRLEPDRLCHDAADRLARLDRNVIAKAIHDRANKRVGWALALQMADAILQIGG